MIEPMMAPVGILLPLAGGGPVELGLLDEVGELVLVPDPPGAVVAEGSKTDCVSCFPAHVSVLEPPVLI
jgi:hypothetical protein